MIGYLPKSIELNDKEYPIRSDFRYCLRIIQAMQDEELTIYDKYQVLMKILYIDDIPPELTEQALKKAISFLDCNSKIQKPIRHRPLYDWEQDEQMIFSAINKVAGTEIRLAEYCHWWTFLGYFNEINDGVFMTIISIRDKRNRHKKLEKHEQEFYNRNKEIIDLKRKYTAEEKSDLAMLNDYLMKGGK